MSAESQDTRNTAWSSNKSNFGYKMLQKMGWKEGKGLGKEETGRVVNVRVAKRAEGLALGANEDAANNGAFVDQIKGFNEVLAALNQSPASSENTKSKMKRKREPANSLAGKKAKSGIAYNKILKNKDVSRYSAKEMSEIFGGVSSPAPAVEPTRSRPRTRSWSAAQEAKKSAATKNTKAEKKKKKKKEKKEKKKKKKKSK